ncbi:hypothetical protein KCU65_g4418, partial [Aureobasidium melanogenum]
MRSNILLPPCSGADHKLVSDRVSSPTSSRTRLDAAAADRLLSAVTPVDSDIMGLGISFDLEPSPTISTKPLNDGSLRNSKNKAQSTTACNTLVSASKISAGAAAPLQNNLDDVPTARNGPPRWPSGVPGLGNTILGPRCPRISNVSCAPITTCRNSPILPTHVPSPTIPFLAPPSRKASRAIRTSNKRRATSPPSTGLSAKMARVSVDSISAQAPANSISAQAPANTIYAQPPANTISAQPAVVKHDQKDDQSMAPKRSGPRRLGFSETEKRAKAAELWKAEQEKIARQMEKAITHEAVPSSEMGSCVGKQQSVQKHPDTILGGRAEVVAPSPEVQKISEHACDTAGDAPQLSIEQGDEDEENHKGLQNTKLLRQGARAGRRIAKLDQAGLYKQISQPLSPETQMNIEYACDTPENASQLSVEQNEHEGSQISREHTEPLREGCRAERRIAKLDQTVSYKQLSPSPAHLSTNTPSQDHTSPSAIKKSVPTTASSNDKKRVSFADPPHLNHLVHDFLALLEPYTRLHFSCPAVRPLRLIHASLSSSSPSARALVKALKDAQELLKVLAADQAATLERLEAMKEDLEKVGMEGVVTEARERIQKTEGDVEKLGEWIGECDSE